MESEQTKFTDVEPHIDYLAKDFNTFRQLMLDHLSVLAPNWTEKSPADLGHVLVETLAYAADYLSYYQDAVASEAYLSSARLRRSVRRHARLLDYFLHEGCNARVWVQIIVTADGVRLAQGSHLLTDIPGLKPVIDPIMYSEQLLQSPLVFATLHDIDLFKAHNAIPLHTANVREAAMLPAGATHAWLKAEFMDDSSPQELLRVTKLEPGDVLILDEILDPKTGEERKDPKRRHAVRLTDVSYHLRPQNESSADRKTPLVKIEWSEADALPFALHIAPYGKNKNPVTVARGNIVLADQGRRIQGDRLPPVLAHVRYRPALRLPGLTHRVAYRHQSALGTSASESLEQDPRQAMPDIRLLQQESILELSPERITLLPSAYEAVGQAEIPQAGILREWNLRRDLLNSDRFARDYLVEMEENELAFLRFGFGDMGQLPEPGDEFIVDYRIGNGAPGNVGPDTIHHLVLESDRAEMSEGSEGNTLTNNRTISIKRIWNPLSAKSGTDPEQIEEVRLHAPYAFRRQKEQCITEEDYAEMATRYPGVLQAAARIRYVGVWHTAFIYVRRANFERLSHEFRTRILDFMQRYRQAGYEIDFKDPYFVALKVALKIHLKAEQRAFIVQSAINKVLSNQSNGDGSIGFFHPANFALGQPVYRSHLVAALMAIAGVERVEVLHFGRADGEANVAVIPIDPLEVAELQKDPENPNRSTLELEVKESDE